MGEVMKKLHVTHIISCIIIINACNGVYAQTMSTNDSHIISPAKTDRMRRNFKIYTQNPSDENLALAQDVINALHQDNSKQALTIALQKKLDAVKANIVQPTTQTTSAKSETAHIIDTIGVIRTSAVEMANQIIDERLSCFESMQQQKESMLMQLKNNEAMLAQLENELESTRLSYANAQTTFKTALAKEQALTHKEQATALQEKERFAQEAEKNKKLNKSLQELEQNIQDLRTNNTAMLAQIKDELSSTRLSYNNAQTALAEKNLLIEQAHVIAEKEAEKNKQLCLSVQELEHHIQDLRTNHTTIISKLESRINAAESQAHIFETSLAQHVQHLKNERITQFKNELLLNHVSYNNARETFKTALAKEQALTRKEQTIAAQERTRAKQEAEKNKNLTLCVQQLERNIHHLRTNHEVVISKLESLLRATDSQEHPFETAQALHIKNLKDPRISWVNAQ